MQGRIIVRNIFAAIPIAFALCNAAHADEPDNTIKIGYAYVNLNLKSGDLTGPPGTTPPGLRMGVKDLDILAISVERRLSRNWAVQLQAGVPPTLTAVGAGTGQSVGTVATARIWFPTVLALYTFTDVPVIRPYLGAGVTYTFFTDEKSSSTYTAAVQGTSSSIHLQNSWSPYARIGFEYPIDKHWAINMEYSRFRMKTVATVVTQTPGIGAISRRIDIKGYPQIFGLTLGYKF
ncbi:OmpW/AlkL family protein [Cupriavidus basilensis]|uniref:Outer membrane protein W n=1 Tax=Cupriavidus basilensis TaxID=68895 RepID=A0A0C4YPR3_9BURK|nr:OmpW family outer membrane protein [Cupriavidus basilensis]AJG22556.1 Outer membrane protein W precursor [Cupriavidus basilensis]